MAMYRGKNTHRTKHKRSMYSSNYKFKRSTRTLKIVGVVLLLMLLFLISIYVLGPMLESAFPNTDIRDSSTSSTISDAASENNVSLPMPADTSGNEGISSQRSEDVPSDTSSLFEEDAFDASYMLAPVVFTNASELDRVLIEAKRENATEIILEIKGYDGLLYYQSNLTSPKKISAIATTAINLNSVIDKINSKGMKCSVAMWTFDEMYTANKLRSTAIKYNFSDTTRWLDYYRTGEESQLKWQDPGLDPAREYELDIIEELSTYNVDSIILFGCHYPVWGSLKYCTPAGSTEEADAPREENIASFVSIARGTANKNGTKLCVAVATDVAVNDDHSRTQNYGYPDNVYTLDCDEITADLRMDRILNKYYTAVTVNGKKYKDFTSDTENKLTILAGAVRSCSYANNVSLMTEQKYFSLSELTTIAKETGIKSATIYVDSMER